MCLRGLVFLLFFFNDTATTEIYTLSLHDALPISRRCLNAPALWSATPVSSACARSEEHTSELQSQFHLVCRLLLEKKNSRSNPKFPSVRQILLYRAIAPDDGRRRHPARCLSFLFFFTNTAPP